MVAIKAEAMDDPIAQVKATVRIQEYIVNKMGVQPAKLGHREMWFLCPFHKESTPSLHVRFAEQTFKCFGCGAGGDVIDLEMKATGETNARVAAENILREYGRQAEPAKVRVLRVGEPGSKDKDAVVLSRDAQEWLQSRGVSAAVAIRNGVSGQKNAIEFPYVNDGEVVNRQTRTLSAKGFRFEAGKPVIPFGLDDCEGQAEVVIVEGVMDKLSIEEATGRTAVLAMPSATPSSECYALACEACKAASKIIVAVDNDEPGEKLRDELIRRLGADRCWTVDWNGCKDANEVLLGSGAEGLEIAIFQAVPMPVEGVFTVDDSWDAIERLYEFGLVKGDSTGWPKLDRYYTVRRKQLTVITGTPGSGKALAVNTPIPTPFGWTTMGDLQVGDWVFGEDGCPVQVVRATEVMHERECFRVTFSDGAQIVCDAEHQWMTRDDKARQSAVNAARSGRAVPREVALRGTDQSYLRTFPSTKTTREIADSLWAENGARANHSVAVAGVLNLGDAELPIDPYVLGAWLGDGHSYWAKITCADQEIIDEIERRGHHCTKHSTRLDWGIADLKTPLRLAGLLKNKHVPERYLRSSEEQRLDLLRGLMDTDGYATQQGTCEFTSTNKRLADGVFELVASLGMVPTVSAGRAMLNGKDCGPKWRVRFRPVLRVFGLARKQERCETAVRPSCGFRRIVGCDPVESVPVKCIQVDNESHQYLCGREMIPTHNSVWSDALIMNLAKGSWDWKFAICSPEMMPMERHWSQFMSLYAGQPFSQGPTQRMDAETLRQAREFIRDKFFMVLPEEPTLDAVTEKFLWTHRRHGVGGLLLDPWNEMEHNRPAHMSETEWCNQELRKLKRIGWNYDVAIWLVAHTTKMYRDKKSGEYPVPTMYDINGSAAFFNKADNGIVIFRDKADETKPSEVHVQKVRHQEIGGLTGENPVKLRHDKVSGRYWETVDW